MQKLFRKVKGEDNINVKLLFAVSIVLIIFLMTKSFKESFVVQQLFSVVEQLGVWAPVFYILLYIFISGIIVPSIVFKVFAGTLFGVVDGVIVISIASTISSLIKFLLARYFFRESVSKRIKRSKKLTAIDHVIEQDGWKVLVILRNVPVLNTMFLNYICGVTRISVSNFVSASFVGRLPTTFMYVYLGYLARHTAGLEAQSSAEATVEWIVLGIGLIATVGFTYYIVNLSKKVLSQKSPQTIYSV